MMKVFTVLSALVLTTASVIAAPAASPANAKARQVASGCYPFEDPDLCIDYAVCQCANGWFYEFNVDNYNAGDNGCDPPWGVLSTVGEPGLPGYCG